MLLQDHLAMSLCRVKQQEMIFSSRCCCHQQQHDCSGFRNRIRKMCPRSVDQHMLLISKLWFGVGSAVLSGETFVFISSVAGCTYDVRAAYQADARCLLRKVRLPARRGLHSARSIAGCSLSRLRVQSLSSCWRHHRLKSDHHKISESSTIFCLTATIDNIADACKHCKFIAPFMPIQTIVCSQL